MKKWTTVINIIIYFSAFYTVESLEADDGYTTYQGYQVLRIHGSNVEKRQEMKHYLETQCEIMKFSVDVSRPFDVLCPPMALNAVKEELNRQGVEFNVEVEDMGELIRENESPKTIFERQMSTMDWEDFHRYETIVSWMEQIAADNPSFTTLLDMGRSVEGRKIYALKIGNSPLGNKTRAVWIDGGVHAREWVSISTATFIINKLIENFQDSQSDCTDRSIQSVDWYVAPLVNPDGYEYSHTNDRMWRKNRQVPPEGQTCYGVDLNRNWDVVGYGTGSSADACSLAYRGESANSEPETQAMVNTIMEHKDNIRVYISLHSYGQYWLTMWAYTNTLPKDNDKQMNLARKAVNGINCINPSRQYTVGPVAVVLYFAGGSSLDWAKINAKIPYSFGVELPDKSFVLPQSEIIPVGNEMWAAMKEIAPEAARHPLGPDTAAE